MKEIYSVKAVSIDELDGLSMSFENWRFNIRESNTEPLVRLNLETKSNRHLLIRKTEELKGLITGA